MELSREQALAALIEQHKTKRSSPEREIQYTLVPPPSTQQPQVETLRQQPPPVDLLSLPKRKAIPLQRPREEEQEQKKKKKCACKSFSGMDVLLYLFGMAGAYYLTRDLKNVIGSYFQKEVIQTALTPPPL